MSRPRKTFEDDAVNAQIGARVAGHRIARGWSLRHVSERMGLSIAHLNALEAGKHTFSAALLLKLSGLFGEPMGALIGSEPPRDDLSSEWSTLFDALPRRDRVVVLDLARKLANWSETFVLRTTRRPRRHAGGFISLEGIDGVLLKKLALEIISRYEGPSSFVTYDHQSELWRHMRARFSEHASGASLASPALERTLLFACERLQRQQTAIRPSLSQNMLVLSPFFAMAPSVYQEADGIGDRRVIEIIESLLIQPDVVVVVYSSPYDAARRATLDVPTEDQFHSPYVHEEDFERAQTMYGKAHDEFSSRGYIVHEFDLRDTGTTVATAADEIVEALRGSTE